MRFSKTLASATAVAALALAGGAALPVAAQSLDGGAEVETPDYSDAQLQAFAETALQVAQVRDDYAQQLEMAEGEAEQQELIDEGNAAMLDVVEESPNISLDDYLEIGEAAAADPELGERIAMMINEMEAN